MVRLMDPAQALSDLTEISSQIEAAVVLGPDGSVIGSTLGEGERADAFGRAAQELLAAAEEAGGSGEPLVQLEAATHDGSVFIVRDGDRAIAATTSTEPTVGLVFYDLKSCLRSLAEEEPKPKRQRKPAGQDDGAAS
jgi:predicted regulator of Ras-like GTPase activity (Roadblock/LC7/MglB family)